MTGGRRRTAPRPHEVDGANAVRSIAFSGRAHAMLQEGGRRSGHVWIETWLRSKYTWVCIGSIKYSNMEGSESGVNHFSKPIPNLFQIFSKPIPNLFQTYSKPIDRSPQKCYYDLCTRRDIISTDLTIVLTLTSRKRNIMLTVVPRKTKTLSRSSNCLWSSLSLRSLPRSCSPFSPRSTKMPAARRAPAISGSSASE